MYTMYIDKYWRGTNMKLRLVTTLEAETKKKLKIMSANELKDMNEILEELINERYKRYEEKKSI